MKSMKNKEHRISGAPEVRQQIAEIRKSDAGYEFGEAKIQNAQSDFHGKLEQRPDEIIEVNGQLENEMRDRKKVEKDLWEYRIRNEKILKTAIDGFSIMNTEGRILEVNPAACAIYGYSPEEMICMNIIDLKAEKPQDGWSHGKRAKERGYDRIETRHRRKDGQIVELQVSTNFVEIGDKKFYFSFFHDITERKQAEKALKDREKELEIETVKLAEVNTALKVLLKRREEDKKVLEEEVLFNVKELVMPILEKLKESGLNERQKAYSEILESSLNEIISPFSRKFSFWYLNFTPTEIQVANLVKFGKTTKEIANLLNVSSDAIALHRKNIRKKIGISKKKANLRTHLLFIEE